jgi:hypothetical protein
MLTKHSRQALKLLLLLAITLSPAPSVRAHGGPPRVELGARHATAGEPLEVRGINLGADLPVTITLLRDDVEYPLGTAICDGQGDFSLTFMLPRDLAPGTYTVRAINASDLVVEARLDIETVNALAALTGWIMGLQSVQWPVILGILAVIFAGLALIFRWRDARNETDR